ncbi:MAG TPA: hypothetical protein VE085_15505 [Burkholderiales bacterium]|nr:hypothetical protein [Burkholderiales bacterium]
MQEEVAAPERAQHDTRDFRAGYGRRPGARGRGGDPITVIGVVERYRHTDLAPLVSHRGSYAEL